MLRSSVIFILSLTIIGSFSLETVTSSLSNILDSDSSTVEIVERGSGRSPESQKDV